jgi:hypothetical protein
MLPTGQLFAVKRCRQGSVQGGLEFNAEIEVLSRVHHKNVVNLVGFCFERGEQMLIYEFVRNGSLRDSLSGIALAPINDSTRCFMNRMEPFNLTSIEFFMTTLASNGDNPLVPLFRK